MERNREKYETDDATFRTGAATVGLEAVLEGAPVITDESNAAGLEATFVCRGRSAMAAGFDSWLRRALASDSSFDVSLFPTGAEADAFSLGEAAPWFAEREFAAAAESLTFSRLFVGSIAAVRRSGFMLPGFVARTMLWARLEAPESDGSANGSLCSVREDGLSAGCLYAFCVERSMPSASAAAAGVVTPGFLLESSVARSD
jgi:hypothetical protein